MKGKITISRQQSNFDDPTPIHIQVEDVDSCIDFDCSTSYLDKPIERLSGQQWLDSKISRCYKDIEYHSKEHLKEIEMGNGRNQWLKQLRESLQ